MMKTRAAILFFLAPAMVGAAELTPPPGNYGLERQEMRAQLTPRRSTTLSAELAAKISRIPLKEGERFKEGQLLVQFDCALQAAQLDKATNQLQAARNTFEGLSRLSQLNAVGRVELRNGETEVRKAKADVNYLQAMNDKCTVTAPFTGMVAEEKAREQQFVQAGQPLLDILDDSVLELEIMVPSRWLSWLKPDHPFTVQIDDTGKSYPVKLLRMGARVDPVSQSVHAVAVIDGHFPELMAGMSGGISLAPPTDSITP